MKPVYRYGIIALCFVVFFVLAPLLVVYVTGEVYDTATHRFVKTGILSVATDPRGASLYLNGKLAGTTPVKIHFLTPGDYDVKISKAGYFDWTKRLSIRPQFTTFVNPNIDSLYMYRSQPTTKQVAANVQDFTESGNTLAYLTPSSLVVGNVTDTGSAVSFPAPADRDFTDGKIKASPNGQTFLVSTKTATLAFDISSKKFTDLTPLKVTGEAQFGAGSDIYWLSGGALSQVNWQSQAPTLNPIAENVAGYSAGRAGVYILQHGTDADSLSLLQLPQFNPTVLRDTLPPWTAANLYVNAGNQVFINSDGSLFAVNNLLDQVGSYVKSVRFYDAAGKAMFSTGNEIDLYDIYGASSQLVTRSSSSVADAQATPNTADVFFIADGRLQGIETDARDHQNSYTFAQVGTGAEYAVTDDAKFITLLDSGTLEQLQIR